MTATPQKTTFQNVTGLPYRGLAEGGGSACCLDLYHPENAAGFATVVWLYGGGLVSGQRHVPAELKEQGLAVVAVDYRLHPQVHAPVYIEDAAAAVAWTFRHIASYGGDPGRIFLAGASAGGYLAMMVGLDRRWLAACGESADGLAGVVALTGQMVTHFTVRAERGIPERQVVVDDLAPLFHVRADAPPILLVTGDRELELLGRYEENAFFQRMLQVAGHTQNELHELKGRDHGGVEAPGHALLLDFVRRTLAEG